MRGIRSFNPFLCLTSLLICLTSYQPVYAVPIASNVDPWGAPKLNLDSIMAPAWFAYADFYRKFREDHGFRGTKNRWSLFKLGARDEQLVGQIHWKFFDRRPGEQIVEQRVSSPRGQELFRWKLEGSSVSLLETLQNFRPIRLSIGQRLEFERTSSVGLKLVLSKIKTNSVNEFLEFNFSNASLVEYQLSSDGNDRLSKSIKLFHNAELYFLRNDVERQSDFLWQRRYYFGSPLIEQSPVEFFNLINIFLGAFVKEIKLFPSVI